MVDVRSVNDSYGILTIDIFRIHGIAISLLKPGGVLAEVQEGLSLRLIDVIGWLRECTVRIMNSVDDLIVLCSYESNAAIPVHVGKCCVGCIKIRGIILSIWSAGVDRIAAFKKHRGDQRLGSFVVLHNCNIGGVASI